MKQPPSPEDRHAWSAVGIAIATTSIAVLLALELQPSSSHVSPPLVYGSGVFIPIGGYPTLAPLRHWWPWSSSVVKPLGLAVMVGLIVASLSLSHNATQASLRHRLSKPTARGSHGVRLVAYHGTHLTVEIPAGWRTQEHEVQKSSEIESTWLSPYKSKRLVTNRSESRYRPDAAAGRRLGP